MNHTHTGTEHREERQSDRTQTTHSPESRAHPSPGAGGDTPASAPSPLALTPTHPPRTARPGEAQSRRSPAKSPVTMAR